MFRSGGIPLETPLLIDGGLFGVSVDILCQKRTHGTWNRCVSGTGSALVVTLNRSQKPIQMHINRFIVTVPTLQQLQNVQWLETNLVAEAGAWCGIRPSRPQWPFFSDRMQSQARLRHDPGRDGPITAASGCQRAGGKASISDS